MTWTMLSSLVPRLGSNTLACEPNDFIKTIKSKNNSSYKSFCTKSKSVEQTLIHLREYFGPHKLLMRHLEELHNTTNYKHSVRTILIDLRKHISAIGDVKDNIFHYQGRILTLEIIN